MRYLDLDGFKTDNDSVGYGGELVDEPPRVLWGCRAPLKLVETAPLLLGGLGQKRATKICRYAAPTQADDVDAGLGEVELVGGAGRLAPGDEWRGRRA